MPLPLLAIGAANAAMWGYRALRLHRAASAMRTAAGAAKAGAKAGAKKLGQGYNNTIERGVQKAMGTSKTVVPAKPGFVQKGRQYKFVNQKTGEGVNRKTAERFASVQRAKLARNVATTKSAINTTVGTTAAVEAGSRLMSMAPKKVEQPKPTDMSDLKNFKEPGAFTIPKGKSAAKPARNRGAKPKGATPATTTPALPVPKGIDEPVHTQPKGVMKAQAGTSQSSEPEITMSSIMKKFSVADAKSAGLKASNAEAKSTGFMGSFQRFTEGNIDQEGSAAYNKYGAGRGYQELLKQAKAKKK